MLARAHRFLTELPGRCGGKGEILNEQCWKNWVPTAGEVNPTIHLSALPTTHSRQAADPGVRIRHAGTLSGRPRSLSACLGLRPSSASNSRVLPGGTGDGSRGGSLPSRGRPGSPALSGLLPAACERLNRGDTGLSSSPCFCLCLRLSAFRINLSRMAKTLYGNQSPNRKGIQ